MSKRHAVPLLTSLTLATWLAACGGGGGGGGGSGTDPAAANAALGVEAVRSLAAGAGALEPIPSNALSGNVTCRNRLIEAARLDSVFVPDGAACQLRGTALVGNITVGRGGLLDARQVVVNGNLQAEGAAHVEAIGSRFGGSVQIKQGGTARLEANDIGGDLQLDSMSGAVLAIDNRVTGSLQAVGNRGGLTLTGNTMRGNLQCKENSPVPRVGNNVATSIEDQCVPGANGSAQLPGGLPALASSPATGGNVSCVGQRIAGVSLDTVTVPDNASCALEGTRLIGSVIVGRNAVLTANGVAVSGNVQAEGAASVVIGGPSRIGGSVQIKQGLSASVSGATIGGDLQFDAMQGPVSAAGNRIEGNLQAVRNRGGVSLNANALGGNLQCKENLPAPIGSGNLASSREDQCTAL